MARDQFPWDLDEEEYKKHKKCSEDVAVHVGDEAFDWDHDGLEDDDNQDGKTEMDEDQAWAEKKLVNLLLDEHLKGRMSAKLFCSIAYLAAKAGATCLESFGLHPNSHSGNFKKHVDVVLESGSLLQPYILPVPAHVHQERQREVHNLVVHPPHELVAADMRRHGFDDEVLLKTSLLEAGERFPPNFWQDKLHRQTTDPIVPMALFVDGVLYKRKQTMVVFVVVNLLTNTRMLSIAIRKKLYCTCGCKGWCSVYPIWLFLQWSFQCLREGVFPTHDHAGIPFAGKDVRSAVQGKSFGCRGILTQLRLDWSEWCSTVGVPSWKSNKHCCMFCDASHEGMLKDLSECGYSSSPHRETTHEDMRAAASACMIWVTDMSLHDLHTLQANVALDRRKHLYTR
eukprot:2581276-Amphidinium_carterae.1